MPFQVNPDNLSAHFGEEKVRAYVDKKYDTLEKSQQSQLEQSFREAIVSMFQRNEYLLVVEGQLKNSQGEREIVLKLSTFQVIFAILERKLEKSADVLAASEFAGNLVGRSFAKTIITGLLNDNVLLDYHGYLQYWCRLDTRAAWGEFVDATLNEQDRQITLGINHPLIATGSGYTSKSIDRFLSGYIFGVIDEGFRRLSYLIEISKHIKLPHESLTVQMVEIRKQNSNAQATIKLEPTWLKSASEQLFDYEYSQPAGIESLRRCMEHAMKGMLGYDVMLSNPPALRIMKALSNSISTSEFKNIDIRAWDRLWTDLNKVVHRGGVRSGEERDRLLRETEYFLAELMIHRPSKGVIRDLKRAIDREPSPEEIDRITQELESIRSRNQVDTTNSASICKRVDELRDALNKCDTVLPYLESQIAQLRAVDASNTLRADQIGKLRELEQKLRNFRSYRKDILDELDALLEIENCNSETVASNIVRE